MELLPDIPGVHNSFKFEICFIFNWDMMEYVLEICKKSWKCTVKKNFKLRFFQQFSSYCIFSLTNVFIGFYNKKGIKWFETCTYIIKFKKYIFSSKLRRCVSTFMELTVLKKIWTFFLTVCSVRSAIFGGNFTQMRLYSSSGKKNRQSGVS